MPENEEKFNGTERRFYKRINVRLPVKVTFIATDTKAEVSKFLETQSVNISGGGVSLELQGMEPELMPKLFSGMIRIGLKFEIPSKSTIDNPLGVFLLAKAIWITKQKDAKGAMPVRIGLQFIDITEQDRDKIIDFVVGSFLDKG